MTSPSATTVEELLSGFPPEIRELTLRARQLVIEQVPGAEERVYPGWRGIGYRDGQAGYFCGIFPQSDHVRLLFERGRELTDADRLLEGNGTQTRYVTLRAEASLPAAGIRELLDEALRRGALR